jgi:hypothetical protein
MADAKIRDPKRERVPYFKYAFHNVYNYTILGGVAAAALLTQNWWLAIVGGGLETLWLVFGPDSKALQRLWFDKVHEEKLLLEARAEQEAQLKALPASDVQRFRDLERQKKDILRLCAENQRFTQELLKDELSKLDQLVESFLDLMVSAHKNERYLSTVDVDDLESDLERYRRLKEKAKDDTQLRLAEKNLAVLEQRREKIAEIRRFVSQAFGQMDLIENSFRLLADQIVTMHSPREMGGQLDDLIGGVEAVRSTARETESLLQAIA